ncbi:hypothetical protein EJC49_04755 [Aquibium carbonis]|uniref:Uncharacterized protein n=1 Tax=Aquibium carbonis TaxID=2495581 RepID=A0A429Z1M3_9HYPH|nr:hypothetical protein [Aquibium carbonis]RST87538.1 hypothetical protein EJC49_04755 [Aquibium carbonis]
MKKIVILGAKPGAVIPTADAIYAANAAVMGHEAAFAECRERIVVASSTVLAKGIEHEAGGDDLYGRKLAAVRASGASRLVLFADPGRRNHVDRVLSLLATSDPAPATTVISVRERTAMVENVGRLRYPVMDRTFFSQPVGVQLRDATEIAGYWLNRVAGDGMKDVRAKYRPSTGILALLLAITENGEAATYIICGIGLSDRNVFLTSGGYRFNRNNAGHVLPKHTRADMILLARLRERYRLVTTEPELAGLADLYGPTAAASGTDACEER